MNQCLHQFNHQSSLKNIEEYKFNMKNFPGCFYTSESLNVLTGFAIKSRMQLHKEKKKTQYMFFMCVKCIISHNVTSPYQF